VAGLRRARPLFIVNLMMPPSRRKWIELSAAALSTAGIEARAADSPAKRRTRFGVSTYSYWHFKGDKYPIERVIEDAGRIGFDGVEVLHRQMSGESVSYLNQLKRSAFRNGLDLIQLSIHQDFVSPDAQERRKQIDHTVHCIELAAQLGAPSIRLNSGRWKTIASFDDLMKVKGDEPPLPGYTNEDALKWCIDSIQECLPAAEKAGVILDLENHWGLTTKTEALLHIHRVVNSPWLGINLDVGNFPGDPYPEIEKIAPHANIVHFKTYFGGGVWYTLDLDYRRIAGILRNANFTGYVSLEMEDNEPAATAVPKSMELMRAAFV
jgi:sugar phosphate isomerase/epimerase